jgi:Predicted nucleoside-diphosphate-sugar epimerases
MENNKRTAVVFGGTGLVGKALIKELIDNQDYGEIIAVLRNDLPFSNPKLEQLLFSDFRHLIHLKGELNATDYFCCIGTTIKKAGSQKAFQQVDHDIPVQIAKLAHSLSIPNMVAISSLGANAASSNFYLRTKGKMENSVRKSYTGNLKIVRPSLLMGRRNERRFGEKAGILFMRMFGWLLLGPLNKFKGIEVTDLAKVMVGLAKDSSGQVFFESKELRALRKRK